MVSPFAVAAGLGLILLSLWDAFETVILPRTIVRFLRLSRLINVLLWRPWARVVAHVRTDSRRERYLSVYGPLSIILMLAIWAGGLLCGFALVSYGLGSAWSAPRSPTFFDDIYVSGTTLFTLGMGDVVPTARITRLITVIECGLGLGYLTLGLAYLPVIYQAFSRREAQITLLDAWAGSPPSSVEMLRRVSAAGAVAELQTFLRDWERWSAELLESHISYPQIAYFRSQHGRQSWLSALTAVLDTSAIVLTGLEGVPSWQARQTFAIARHAAVDLSQVLSARPKASVRLAHVPSEAIVSAIESAGYRFRNGDAAHRLTQYRKLYESYVTGLSDAFSMDLPSWMREGAMRDNWEATPKADREAHL
jgi:hypothetical protein